MPSVARLVAPEPGGRPTADPDLQRHQRGRKTTLSDPAGGEPGTHRSLDLLVDFDLRRPMIHRLFDRRSGTGVSELLRASQTSSKRVRPTSIPQPLHRPGREWKDPSFGVLTNGTTHNLMQRFREAFDFILLETAVRSSRSPTRD